MNLFTFYKDSLCHLAGASHTDKHALATVEIMAPINFTADLSDFPLQNGSHQGFQVRSGSQITDCNYCFCYDHFSVCFLH